MNYNQPETDNIDTQCCKKCWKKYPDEKTLKKSFEIEIDFNEYIHIAHLKHSESSNYCYYSKRIEIYLYNQHSIKSHTDNILKMLI